MTDMGFIEMIRYFWLMNTLNLDCSSVFTSNDLDFRERLELYQGHCNIQILLFWKKTICLSSSL